MRVMSVETRARKFAPSAGSGWGDTRSAEPNGGGDKRPHADGNHGPSDHLHRGASWNRTSDLTLIRGAL